MKPALVGSLLILCLLAIGIRAQTSGPREAKPQNRKRVKAEQVAQVQRTVAVSQEAGDNGPPSWTVEGLPRETSEEAYQDALKQATLAVNSYLRAQTPPVQAPLSEGFVGTALVEERKETFEEIPILEDDSALMTRCTLKVAIRDSDRREILSKDQEFRMKSRMMHMAKMLGVLVLLLGVVAGYVHLDEKTKGYFTTWLAVAVVAAVVVGAGVLLLL